MSIINGGNSLKPAVKADQTWTDTETKTLLCYEQTFAVLPNDVMALVLSQLKLPQIANFSLTSKLCYAMSFQFDDLWRLLFTKTFSVPLRFPLSRGCCLEEYKHQNTLNANLKNEAYTEQILIGHESRVVTVAIDYETIVSGSLDGTIRIWDLETGNCINTLTGHEGPVLGLAASNGRIVSGSFDRTIKIWNFETGECLKTLDEDINLTRSLALHNGMIICSSDQMIRIWDLEAGKCLKTLQGHEGTILSLAIVDGMIISGSTDCTIKIWDFETGKCLSTLHGHEEPISSLVTANGKIISSSQDKTIKIWDLETGNCINTLPGHEDTVNSLVVFNGMIISSSFDKTTKIWDLETGNCLGTFKGFESVVHDVACAGGKIVLGLADNTIKLWNLDPNAILDEIANQLNCERPDQAKALEKFSKLPNFIKNMIYEEFSKILKANDQPNSGNLQEAFLDKTFSTFELKALAVQNYLMKASHQHEKSRLPLNG